ncbi:MAG TPA: N-acetylmuramic acid 6-phosphate etherase [Chloroflexia bacterium]|nr:N-acetylmuramic acid 6-phosphate etherase [Chloroflexia bacterium]
MTPLELARVMNDADATVAPAVAQQLPQIAAAIAAITDRLAAGGRLIYMGAGTSGRLGVLDASECPPTFNTPPEQVIGWIAGGPAALTTSIEAVEDDPDLGRADAARQQIGAGDVLVGIAASGRTPYVLGALTYAREVGALTVALACNADPPIGRAADITIAVETGPEIVNGSTRLKAGTAQKMVLNMLSTGVMIRLGKTYGNLMVDVQLTNAKLRRRAVAIVETVTGLATEDAAALLAAAGDTKTALVAALAGVPPAVARERLRAAGGVVRRALEG